MTELPPIPAGIEDYALLSDRHAAALVSRSGSIDWLCWPRFDSPACLAALLGTADHGHWQISPADPTATIERRYYDGSMVLETVFTTDTGTVALIDFMPLGGDHSAIIRIVEARSGSIAMQMRLKLRFDYGSIIPWVTQLEGEADAGVVAIAGPDLVVLRADVPTHGENLQTVADFTLAAGEQARFELSHGPSHLAPPPACDPRAALRGTDADWRAWSERCSADGPYRQAVTRSLLTLKALTYAPTGGIIAAPTTSLPESPGGARNWDYRYCWLRDATLTLIALMDSGYYEEAQDWGNWLHRSVAGSAAQVQIMYGIAGERRLDEWTVPWLPGYQNARPVRIGNGAAGQVQLDVFGEVMGAMRQLRLSGLVLPPASWELQCNLLDHLETIWEQPDEGMWEVRGGRRQFTLSKIMAWSAFDSAIKDAEGYGLAGPVERWRGIRDRIHALVCERGFDRARNSFTQSFDTDRLDASLLLLPAVGFLPAQDPRVIGTVAAIEASLIRDGLVLRYEPDPALDGQDKPEGAFLACSFWLVNARVRLGRADEARVLFERLAALANDVGLLSEEYDVTGRRQLGNFPQALSHLALVTSATMLRQGTSGRSR